MRFFVEMSGENDSEYGSYHEGADEESHHRNRPDPYTDWSWQPGWGIPGPSSAAARGWTPLAPTPYYLWNCSRWETQLGDQLQQVVEETVQ